ncbi:alpha/beta hydrolase [Rhodanobacter sp. Soil772]|uniref:alpha/beta hydrolase n=1 Tax=Rhodanobacter sp. Soil772 TaxID=1736406 RepID=UPI0006F7DB49|nr:alpha/beta hydrolase [Rhodanobacter sp. Soil772]KRE87088.1 alpha/beta hydrolase [Rhodanobacter sp. Soil772]
MLTKYLASFVLAGVLFAVSAVAQDAKPQHVAPEVAADGAITTLGARFPFSVYASKEALKRFQEMLVEDRNAPDFDGPVEATRAYYDKIDSSRVERMKKLYPVRIEALRIGGVPVDIVTAANVKTDTQRVLINLHWGGFLFGAGNGGLVESIPVASLSKITVISVDYRMGPEHTFPAASEDVEKVYRELLKRYKPQDIGLYGCSAGGALTAESVAWFASKKLPAPGAIGIFCAGVVGFGGDSAYVASLLNARPVPLESSMDLNALPYFHGIDMDNPLVLPGRSPAVLAKFPPTLLISGTRDEELSAVLRTEDLLTQAGVPTELHVWDGMWHRFFADPELPESKAAYAVMARFFDRHLGHALIAASKKS